MHKNSLVFVSLPHHNSADGQRGEPSLFCQLHRVLCGVKVAWLFQRMQKFRGKRAVVHGL
jgi:hypothetical protein